jgi:hypothetical protein
MRRVLPSSAHRYESSIVGAVTGLAMSGIITLSFHVVQKRLPGTMPDASWIISDPSDLKLGRVSSDMSHASSPIYCASPSC